MLSGPYKFCVHRKWLMTLLADSILAEIIYVEPGG